MNSWRCSTSSFTTCDARTGFPCASHSRQAALRGRLRSAAHLISSPPRIRPAPCNLRRRAGQSQQASDRFPLSPGAPRRGVWRRWRRNPRTRGLAAAVSVSQDACTSHSLSVAPALFSLNLVRDLSRFSGSCTFSTVPLVSAGLASTASCSQASPVRCSRHDGGLCLCAE